MKKKPLVPREITEFEYERLLRGYKASPTELLAAEIAALQKCAGFFYVKINRHKIPIKKEGGKS